MKEDLDLAPIKERLAAATRTFPCEHTNFDQVGGVTFCLQCQATFHDDGERWNNDGQPNTGPDELDDIRALVAEVERLREQLTEERAHYRLPPGSTLIQNEELAKLRAEMATVAQSSRDSTLSSVADNINLWRCCQNCVVKMRNRIYEMGACRLAWDQATCEWRKA